MGALIILTAWIAFALAMYVAAYIYDCAIKGCNLNNVHVIKTIALAVAFMVIASVLAATYPRRIRYVESTNIPRYTDGNNAQSGLDSASD